MHEPTTDLALRTTARELVLAFVSAEQDVRAAFAVIVEAERRVNSVFLSDGARYASIRVSACGSRWHDDFKNADETIALMAREAWKAIVQRLELKRFMSIKAYTEMTKYLDDAKLPAITEENVYRFAHDHLAKARLYLKEAVDEVFEFLRPRGNTKAGKLKTNSQLEVPEKVILPYMVDLGWTSGTFKVVYGRTQHLTAIENVFNALDGQGEISKGYQSLLETAIAAAPGGHGETALFEFRAHKNGHLHLRFKRHDLLQRFNMLAGGARLRPAA